MEYNPEDNDVVRLLKKLQDTNGAYPQEMLVLRRQGYLRQVAQVSAGTGLLMGLKNAAKGGKAAGSGLPPAAGTVVEALLVVAIVAEAGAVSYFYRDKLAQYFRSISNSPKVEQVSEPPVFISLLPEMELTPSPAATAVGTLTPIGTSTLFTVPTNGVGIQAASTQALNDGNGNHYGQTPKPDRDKDKGNDLSNKDNNDNKDNKSNSDNKNKP